MGIQQLRRSARLGSEDPNGRDYLANLLKCPRAKLENFIISPSVRPHLQLWFTLCIDDCDRYNDAIDWINTGERGYFYNPSDLEEDLLLMCLREDSRGRISEKENSYGDPEVKTARWITQELWALTAWRIVQANKSVGQPFGRMYIDHTVSCYAFAIDLLCIAFHSIAHRSKDSCWMWLIKGSLDEEQHGETGEKEPEHNSIPEYYMGIEAMPDCCSNTSNGSADSDFDNKFNQTAFVERPPPGTKGKIGANGMCRTTGNVSVYVTLDTIEREEDMVI